MHEPALTFSTAGEGCLLALRADGRDHCLFWPERRGMDAHLLPMIKNLLQQAGVTFAALKRIGVVTGPGSFTGLRIGLATAQGFGIALGVPVVGIDAFSLWQKAANTGGTLAIALDTLRDDVFAAVYDGTHVLVAPKVASLAEWKQLHAEADAICGDAPNLPQRALVIEHEVLARALLDLTLTGDPAQQRPEPVYLRAPEITAPRAA